MNPAIRVSRIMAVFSLALILAAIASLELISDEPIIGLLFLIAAFGSGMNAVMFWRVRNRRPAASQPLATVKPGADFPGLQFVPEDLLAMSTGRPIPWHGGTGILTVKRPTFGKTVSISVDGTVVATPARPMLANPWVECPIPGTHPEVVVVQVQQERYISRVLVFVNGVSLSDGSTLDASRMRKPVARDRFEQGFQPPLFGVPGAVGIGLFCFLCGLSANHNLNGFGPVPFLLLRDSGWLVDAHCHAGSMALDQAIVAMAVA
jgi:hypothetical protein